jgi:hypothetical protein
VVVTVMEAVGEAAAWSRSWRRSMVSMVVPRHCGEGRKDYTVPGAVVMMTAVEVVGEAAAWSQRRRRSVVSVAVPGYGGEGWADGAVEADAENTVEERAPVGVWRRNNRVRV